MKTEKEILKTRSYEFTRKVWFFIQESTESPSEKHAQLVQMVARFARSIHRNALRRDRRRSQIVQAMFKERT